MGRAGADNRELEKKGVGKKTGHFLVRKKKKNRGAHGSRWRKRKKGRKHGPASLARKGFGRSALSGPTVKVREFPSFSGRFLKPVVGRRRQTTHTTVFGPRLLGIVFQVSVGLRPDDHSHGFMRGALCSLVLGTKFPPILGGHCLSPASGQNVVWWANTAGHPCQAADIGIPRNLGARRRRIVQGAVGSFRSVDSGLGSRVGTIFGQDRKPASTMFVVPVKGNGLNRETRVTRTAQVGDRGTVAVSGGATAQGCPKKPGSLGKGEKMKYKGRLGKGVREG